ncbi:MAG: bifunctional [glutamate--ammonia ligase]-adenylyl-L-tyrosine phosphorylase/[glutamate--ammonia-ligase] adenylyltransferase [Thiotrichales bacterium]
MAANEMFDLKLPEDTPVALRAVIEGHRERLRASASVNPGWLDAALPRLVHVWLASDFAAHVCLRHPDTLVDWLASDRFERPHDTETTRQALAVAMQDCADEADLQRRLRRFRHSEMLAIAWRDILDLAPVEETLLALSDLADALIGEALAWLDSDMRKGSYGTPRDREGQAQALVVLGMGKLGGRELNFSSDIDLIFAYPRGGETDGCKPVSNEVYFTRLGQRLIRALDSTTADGFVYRVDMRLRPFGDAGALVFNFGAMENYYETHGREWERYALVKARPLVGEPGAIAELTQRLQGFIYRRYLDFGAIEALREMKQMIGQQAARKGKTDDLKVGPGGIREVEFTVQVFQLIYGGRDHHLQGASLLPRLEYLAERGLMPAEDVAELREGYRFLRRVENRLQMVNDQQVHALPGDLDARWRLARGLGYSDWATFYIELERHRARINAHFQKVFGVEPGAELISDVGGDLAALWRALMQQLPVQEEVLTRAGFLDTTAVIAQLGAFASERRVAALSTQGRQRLDRLMPLLLAELPDWPNPVRTLERVLALLLAIVRRTVYLALLTERPQVLTQLLRLCAASPWIGVNLTKFPILLDELIDPQHLYAPPDKAALASELTQEFTRIDPFEQEQVLDRLRHFKQVQTFRVAAADIVGALPLMKVSDHLTWIAEVLLEQVLRSAWQALAQKHGSPCHTLDGQRRAVHFTIIGYGKLGGLEMGYSSDLDIVFLHDSCGEMQQTDGERPIDNAVFFARLAQRMVQLLTLFTVAGKLYEVDMRLRPSGNSGLLVSGLEAFERYQTDSAWIWEHQALVRARPVAGDAVIAPVFDAVRRRILARPRDLVALRKEVRGMREKMWSQLDREQSTRFDLKKSPGGITDLEFVVQYLVLAYAHTYPQLTDWTDNIRILDRLAETDILDVATARALADAYRKLRDEIHRLTLQEQSAIVDADEFASERALIQRVWQQWLAV